MPHPQPRMINGSFAVWFTSNAQLNVQEDEGSFKTPSDPFIRLQTCWKEKLCCTHLSLCGFCASVNSVSNEDVHHVFHLDNTGLACDYFHTPSCSLFLSGVILWRFIDAAYR